MRPYELNGNILVVDDDKDVTEFLCYTLKNFGHRTHAVGGGTEGIAALKKEAFDIVITDLSMPGINGMGVLQSVTRMKHKPTVLMISGFSTIQAAVEAIRQGAYDFIPKPLHVHRLNDTIQRSMRRQRLVAQVGGQKTMARVLSFSLPAWLFLGAALAYALT